MDIAVDFDGVLFEEAWPDIGKPRHGLIAALCEAQDNHRLILHTCRTGERLGEAIEACGFHGLFFAAINENLADRIKLYGGDCRKISADLYLEDKAVGWSEEAAILALEALR